MYLRRLEEKDREQYVKLARAFYRSPAVLHSVPDSHLERTFTEALRSDAYADIFFLEDGTGAVLGYLLTAKTFSQEAGGLVVWVEELYVCPEYQGQGVGTKALALTERYYDKYARIRLEIEPENTGALRLYQRLGYRVLDYRQLSKETGDRQ